MNNVFSTFRKVDEELLEELEETLIMSDIGITTSTKTKNKKRKYKRSRRSKRSIKTGNTKYT